MGWEVHALVLVFVQAFFARHLIPEILGRDIEIHAVVDKNTVFDIIAKDGQTNERRHQINICALKESYGIQELKTLAWMEGDCNPAYDLTKQQASRKNPLGQLMRTNRI